MLGREHSTQRTRMTEGELEAEIVRERHDWRDQFGPGGVEA